MLEMSGYEISFTILGGKLFVKVGKGGRDDGKP